MAHGLARAVGYPDILILDAKDRPTYIECKTYNAANLMTTMRSFYLSPSDKSKICRDARHLVISYEMKSMPIAGSANAQYAPAAFKLVDLYDLLCDVKYEFNSDNRRLYDGRLVLLEGGL